MQIVVDGILTHYQTMGEKTKPSLLILHGWKRSLQEWLPIAKQLTDKYFIILLDLPGFGGTHRPQKAFSIYDYADFVIYFLEKLHVKKITLLGHSFGGRIGIILGSKTNILEKLILVDSAGIERRTMTADIKIILYKTIAPLLPKSFIKNLRHFLGSQDYKTSEELREIFVKVINEDLAYLLREVRVPTLLIWGSNDTEVPEWKFKIMKKLIPHVKVRVIWGSGHNPHLEKPKEFMEILEENL